MSALKPTYVRFDSTTHQRVKRVAERNGISFSDVVRRAVAAAVPHWEARLRAAGGNCRIRDKTRRPAGEIFV